MVELTAKVDQYESLLKEKKQRQASSFGTYYKDPNLKINLAEIILVVCDGLVRKETTAEVFAKKAKGQLKKYSFDSAKSDQVFYCLLLMKMIKLLDDVELPRKRT